MKMITAFITAALMSLCPDCRNMPNGIDCDDDNRCWAQHPDWDAEAQAHDPDGLQDGLNLGTLTPAPSPVASPLVECWQYGGPGDTVRVCRLQTECYDLHAKVVDELELNYNCMFAPIGDWDWVLADEEWCYGVFDDLGLAVRLRPLF